MKKLAFGILFFVGSAIAALAPIAVSDFDSRGTTISRDDGLVITDQLRSELINLKRLTIIERSAMETILKEQGFQQSGCTGDACAVEAGQLLGVKYIITGSLGSAGSYTLLNSRIIDVATGAIVVNRSIKNRGGVDAMIEIGVPDMAKGLTDELTQYLRQNNLAPQTAVVDSASSKQAGNNSSSKKQDSKANGWITPTLIGGAVVVGGGVVAALLLAPKSPASSSSPAENTGDLSIELP